MMPSEIIAWECGSCTFTNEGGEPGPCLMCCTERPRCKAIAAGATAGDGVGNCAGPPVAQAPVLSAAVAGVAGATARDGAGSCAGPPVAGPPHRRPSSPSSSSPVVTRRHHSRLVVVVETLRAADHRAVAIAIVVVVAIPSPIAPSLSSSSLLL